MKSLKRMSLVVLVIGSVLIGAKVGAAPQRPKRTDSNNLTDPNNPNNPDNPSESMEPVNPTKGLSEDSEINIQYINGLSCHSEAIGWFYLSGVNHNPTAVILTKTKPIRVRQRTAKSLVFNYKDSENSSFQINFDEVVPAKTDHGVMYSKFGGYLIGDQIQTPIVCSVWD